MARSKKKKSTPSPCASEQSAAPKPCCVPSRERAAVLEQVRQAEAAFNRINSGSTGGMKRLGGGAFLMGTDYELGFPADGEGPIREVVLQPFYIDITPVTNAQFAAFIDDSGYRTESERFGWSFVFYNQLPAQLRQQTDGEGVAGLNWWRKIDGACWRHPYGPGSNAADFPNYPAVHIAWSDAAAYAAWAGKRLPTEAEWEYAARGGLEQKIYPWGDELTPGGRHLCNIWQGKFPYEDTAEDGFAGLCPVDAFPPNGFGLLSMTGNCWEWVRDWWSPNFHLHAPHIDPPGPPTGDRKTMKGGSFLCHHSYCNRYRVAARTSNTPDSATVNIGFRCVRDV